MGPWPKAILALGIVGIAVALGLTPAYRKALTAQMTSPTANIAASSMKIGGAGSTIVLIAVYTPSLTPTQIAAALGAVEQTYTVTGLATANKVWVNPPAGQTALCPMTSARASAADTLALTFGNLAVALCTPVAGTYTVLAVRS